MIRCTGSQETKAAPAQRGTAGQNLMSEPRCSEEKTKHAPRAAGDSRSESDGGTALQ